MEPKVVRAVVFLMAIGFGFRFYNRFWFYKDLYGLTLGGGEINNPGRYLPGAPSSSRSLRKGWVPAASVRPQVFYVSVASLRV